MGYFVIQFISVILQLSSTFIQVDTIIEMNFYYRKYVYSALESSSF